MNENRHFGVGKFILAALETGESMPKPVCGGALQGVVMVVALDVLMSRFEKGCVGDFLLLLFWGKNLEVSFTLVLLSHICQN